MKLKPKYNIARVHELTFVGTMECYKDGEVITEDGNIWGYSQDIISEAPSYDDESVLAVFDDAGTPDNIYDDESVGLVTLLVPMNNSWVLWSVMLLSKGK